MAINKKGKIILALGVALVGAGGILFLFGQSALNKRRSQIISTAVPPGYAKDMARQIIADYEKNNK